MLFTSFEFLVFFPCVVLGYYIIGKFFGVRFSNCWLLLAGYCFAFNFSPLLSLLLLIITILTYCFASLIEKSVDGQSRKRLLAICLLLNFSALFVFKYYNFLNESISSLGNLMGMRWVFPRLDILLPIGLSFFSFQTAGYVIDVYRGDLKPERNFLTYASFVSFFPVLLAGPIQRANILIPQLKMRKIVTYEHVIPGLKMMLWGFFMKLCVADRLGTYVDAVFDNLSQHNGASVVISSLFYTIQIYGDFGGYSLIALGCAKVMGFDLPGNFRRPYFSASFKEFWKRWHIALSSWFRDYLYFPLGGSRVKYVRYLLNLMIVFAVSGLWHGASWTFVIWGVIHGLFQIAEALKKKIGAGDECSSKLMRLFKILIVFFLVNFAWIFFRADTLADAFLAIVKIFTDQGFPFIYPMSMFFGIVSMTILFLKDFVDEFCPNWKSFSSDNKLISTIGCSLLAVYILLFGVLDSSQFIYFQF